MLNTRHISRERTVDERDEILQTRGVTRNEMPANQKRLADMQNFT